ncbi:hypothetical protein BN8_01359 [Fibrisoma limi BUZ 3]|uniref:Uncharacterized protein n=1 Tax=Fibrisoma limi BUZ 3 TaxID=1185876 RepID=I2GEN8_9BACT|nr:hypothetical protein [Fibrisoma limi]CCH52363.1 hypothetical protein BN8_01359 [Fibrisoma limi BUZ 3]
MADTNQTYTGTIDVFDPDVVVFTTCKLEVFGFCVAGKEDHYLPENVREQIRKTNEDAVTTTNAVKVPFQGTTKQARIDWINERLKAIDSRVAFIKARTDQLLKALKSSGSSNYDTISKAVTSVLSLIPYVGPLATYFSGKEAAAQQIEQYKLQTLLQDYVKDAGQLAEIRKSLVDELQVTPTPNTTTTDSTSNAPTAVQTWYYLAGMGLLFLLLVWYRRRNQKRR